MLRSHRIRPSILVELPPLDRTCCRLGDGSNVLPGGAVSEPTVRMDLVIVGHSTFNGGGGIAQSAARACDDETFPSMSLLIILTLAYHDGRSATGHLLQFFGVPSPLHRDLGGGVIDVTQILGREFD